jgi:hypothetical protein
VQGSDLWVVCGVKYSDEDDSDRPIFDENIRKVFVRIKDGVRLVSN